MTDRYEKLDSIYSSLPKLDCKGKCQAYCGAITLSSLELERIVSQIGPIPPMRSCRTCSLLDGKTGQCTIYDIRPLICRLWGVVLEMKCPWGCEPDRWVSKEEAQKLLRSV